MRVRLVHWNAKEAAELAKPLRKAGWKVDASLPEPPVLLKQLRESPPDLIVISLDRAASRSLYFANAIAASPRLRGIPVALVGGQSKLTVNDVPGIIAAAKPLPPVKSVMDIYAGRPLAGKLGIIPAMRVGLIQAPPDFAGTLGDLPESAVLVDGLREKADLYIWFTRSYDEYADQLAYMAERLPLWVAWRKGKGLLTQITVLREARHYGLATYKICAVDKEWSAMVLTRQGGMRAQARKPAAIGRKRTKAPASGSGKRAAKDPRRS